MAEASGQEDFSVLTISLPPLPSYPVQTTHSVYLKRNAKIITKNDTRSLFLVNVPVDSTEAHLRGIFSSLVGAGKFEAVTFEQDSKTSQTSHEPGQAVRLAALGKRKREEQEAQNKKDEEAAQLPAIWSRPLRRSGSTAVVLLADDKSVDLVLRAVKKLQKTKKYPVWGEGVGEKTPSLGSQWLKAHNKLSYPGNEVMQDMVDAYFTVYNRKEVEAIKLAKAMQNEPDEDGFITVTKGGRTAPARQEEAEEARKKMLERQQKKKDETGNFYRFQLREKKKAEQAQFLQSFEEDKSRLRAMRDKRRRIQPDT
ncbi:ribosomal RNA-processing protein 7-domain-containing protein [Truncatella angustata]|uniref:Ribosomal RNA-processing protein 7-domain-containing protein n=1 Tax=Truncatella angustata TaxID=152316 RepID=A0A9P8UIN0_9PEZI|nr:ribosomal RNA-processing protein 7-domain-containing protein [Truncatella angustata]KAH6652723.1 ribosomal RNA-processing protein 7-domain-containing protein [Truncatella angustata]